MLDKLKKPESVVASKPKFMISGESGTGKTTFALEFPKPILIDSENGATRAQYQEKLKSSGGMYFGREEGAQDFNEVIKLVKELTVQKHEFKTLIIDSFSYLYMLAAADAEAKGGSEFGRDKKAANIPTRQLMSQLEKIDMNVILIAHSKQAWERKGKDLINAGTTFDGWDKMEYTLDLWIEIIKGGRTFQVKKSRILGLPQGETFPLSYDKFADIYGRNIIEKEAIPIVLATKEQVKRLDELMDGLKVPNEVVEKWLTKCGVENTSEMNNEQINSLIQFCEQKVLQLSMKGK